MFKKIQRYFRRGWKVSLPSPESSYELMMNLFKNDQAFAFSRWGDGEWEAVLDLKTESEANCDGHQYFSSLKEALRAILNSNPVYFLGMQKLAYHKIMGRKIDTYLRKHNIKKEWLNADAFHDASMKGNLDVFYGQLKKRKVLLIGPEHLKGLDAFRFDFFEIPSKNVWLEHEAVLKRIQYQVSQKNYDVLFFCAGMSANWFIDKLYPDFRGFILDMGSVFDPYAGHNSRNYHKTLAAKK